jgi:hypothetical protein
VVSIVFSITVFIDITNKIVGLLHLRHDAMALGVALGDYHESKRHLQNRFPLAARSF